MLRLRSTRSLAYRIFTQSVKLQTSTVSEAYHYDNLLPVLRPSCSCTHSSRIFSQHPRGRTGALGPTHETFRFSPADKDWKTSGRVSGKTRNTSRRYAWVLRCRASVPFHLGYICGCFCFSWNLVNRSGSSSRYSPPTLTDLFTTCFGWNG